jgi:hypothetical protein
MSIFEIAMLVCFGISWPVSMHKSIKTKKVAGKSPVFLIIIAIGYVSGIIHKVFFSLDWVVILYIINCLMVIADCVLYFHYSKYTQEGQTFILKPKNMEQIRASRI